MFYLFIFFGAKEDEPKERHPCHLVLWTPLCSSKLPGF